MSLDFIYNRHSVRKFTQEQVPIEDVKTIIEAATYAPSGKNTQNWHFVVIRDKEKIIQIADMIEKRHLEIAHLSQNEKVKEFFLKFVKYHIAFKSAPTLILAYAGPYPLTELDILRETHAPVEAIDEILAIDSRVQNVSAAMENLLLAASEMGYGTCWMTGFGYARKEIEAFIGLDQPGYDLISMTPLGLPASTPFVIPRKPLDEILTIIE